MTRFDAAKKIISILRDNGHQALLAGGCVRDLLLGVQPKDFDVATDAPPERVVELFHSTKLVGAQFGVVIVRLGGCETEVATFRSDGLYQDGRRPDSVRFASAKEDAMRRDFTINGMFLDPDNDEVVDFVEGREDITAKLVRCIGTPDLRLAEDHLRMLRAVRFAACLGFEIHKQTRDAIQQFAPSISRISPERIRMELELILGHPSRLEGWRLMTDTGLHNNIAPDAIQWNDNQSNQSLRVLIELSVVGDVSLAAAVAAVLLHVDASGASEVCSHLRFSNEMIAAIVRTHEQASYLAGAPDYELADLKILRASPNYSSIKQLAGAIVRAEGLPLEPLLNLIQQAERIREDRVAPPPLLRGEDLIDLGLTPGPQLGDVLKHVYRAQLNEEICDEMQAATLARKIIQDQK